MRQKYLNTTIEPILDTVIEELSQLENMLILKWYRGMAHTLHIHFGNTNKEIVTGRYQEKEIVSGDYSLFFHGEWTATSKNESISSIESTSEQIDSFIENYQIDKCKKLILDKTNRILTINFSDSTMLTAYDRDNSWFVFEKFGQYSYSPKNSDQVEVAKIILEK